MRVICNVGDALPFFGASIDKTLNGDLSPGEYQGLMSAYLFPYQGFVTLAVTINGDPLLTMCSDSASYLMREQFNRFTLDVAAASEQSASLRELIESVVNTDDMIRGVLEVSREATARWYQSQPAPAWTLTTSWASPMVH
jgi:hypothetical protein